MGPTPATHPLFIAIPRLTEVGIGLHIPNVHFAQLGVVGQFDKIPKADHEE
jgi:hypothetical protein